VISATEPLVSVILPTYNREKLLRRAIQSVLDQTYRNIELIVVDDGSTDGTGAVVTALNDPRIRYIRLEKNSGANVARNNGIRAARGDFIGFQDSDDEWFPNKLERQMQVFAGAPPEVGVVYTAYWRVEPEGRTYRPYPWIARKEGDIHDELLNGNFVSTQAAIVRRECFAKAGMFLETLPAKQEWEMFIRLARYYRFRYIDEPLFNSNYTPGSITTNYRAHTRAMEIILEQDAVDFQKNPGLLSQRYAGLGVRLASLGEFAKGRAYLWKAYRLNPLRVKYLAALTLSCFGQKIFSFFIKPDMTRE
jgi:glycosyltransferase involved in cell wall biosynthesis